MATTTTTDPAPNARPRRRASRSARSSGTSSGGSSSSPWRSPSWCPSGTRSWAASGRTGAIRNNPAGLPDPWNFDHYVESLTGGTYWQQLFNSIVIAVIAVAVVVVVSALAAYVFARFAFRGREALFTLFALGLLFPAAVAVLPLYILLRTIGLLDNPLGVALPRGGVRHPADHHHPAPVLPEHPRGAGGCRTHRRLQPLRLLLAGAPAAVATGARHRGRAGARRQLELVPAAAAHPGRAGAVDAAAGRPQLLDAVLPGRGRRSWPTPPCRWCRHCCSTWSPSGSSSAD